MFFFQNFEQAALALKTEFAQKFITGLKYFLASCACPENRVYPEFFKPEGWQPPMPRTPLIVSS